MCIKRGLEEPIIEPNIFAKDDIKVPSIFILTFGDRAFNRYGDILSSVSNLKLPAPNLGCIRGYYDKREVGVVKLYFGAPASIMALEVLIALGVKYFIINGYAGSINPKLRIGDILIPIWGVREEGTSYHYMPENYIPRSNTRLVDIFYEEIIKVKERKRFNVIKGGIWTIDAIFRETRDKIRKYRELGIYGVDMEATAFMTIAEYRKVDIVIATLITDELYHDAWRAALDSKYLLRKARKIEDYLIIASLNMIKRL